MFGKGKAVLKKSIIKTLAYILLCCILLSTCYAEEEASITDLIEDDDLMTEEFVEEEDLDAPESAGDRDWHKPNEQSDIKCDHDLCFWKLNEGETDEELLWKVLMQPVTVLKGGQREKVKVRKEPSESCKTYVGVVTCASQSVHVLERGETWSLIEAYSSCEEGSAVKVWALPFQGYVKTALLQEMEVDHEYALVVDKLQQRLYVYREGHLFSTLLCSTGYPKNGAPWNETPAGEFVLISWTGAFWSDGGLYCDMAIRINDGILLHEVPCLIRTNESTGESKRDYSRCERYLGEKASHGCIRVQKEKTPEGVNMKWLWDHLSRKKPYVKIMIWDEINRTLEYPDDDYLLYYNAKGGKNYHSSPTCTLVNSKYWPLDPFAYSQLDEKPFNKLTACPGCAPQVRKEQIDTINKKNIRTY